jgi:KDO2-lipid IV(A) lauroyltransferase
MSRKSKLEIWLEYSIARMILTSLSLLPRKLAVAIGLSLAPIAFVCLGRLRRVGLRNLEIAFPEMSPAGRRDLLKRSFENLGRVLGEVSHFPRATPETLAQLIEFRFPDDGRDREVYDEARAAGRGVILVSPHLGNWELLVFAYSALVEPISYLARPLDNPLIEEMVIKIRTRFGNRPINKTDSTFTALQVLREGGVLGTLADVNVLPKEGVFVPFFGVPACTTTGVALLAMRTNALIIPICGVWDEDAGHHVAVVGGIVDPVRTGERRQDVIQNSARFTEIIEQLIRAYPDQWIWIHKRWKTRPPGEEDLYASV